MPLKLMLFVLFLVAIVMMLSGPSTFSRYQEGVLIDDFEHYADGGLPSQWKHQEGRRLEWVSNRHMRHNERFYVVREGRNKFLRAYSNGRSTHVVMTNDREGFHWDIRTHPILAWEWRANELPRGAREDRSRLNDTALSLSVVFSRKGVFGRRHETLKYTFSSSLPVGTVLKQDRTRVIVVASGQYDFGRWMQLERDVVDDYRRSFNAEPPGNPAFLQLTTDSDNTRLAGEGDFDNIRVLERW